MNKLIKVIVSIYNFICIVYTVTILPEDVNIIALYLYLMFM